MLQSQKFEVTVTGTHGLIIPDKFATPFTNAGHTRVALRATFNKKAIDFHGKLHYYKNQYLISFGKRYQKALGISINDYFTLQLFEDTSKYGVEVPEEFMAVLESDPEAYERFEALTAGKKRSLIYYVAKFNSIQTKIDKALIISENLKMGITDVKLLIQANR